MPTTPGALYDALMKYVLLLLVAFMLPANTVFAAPPSNDNFANRTVLSAGTTNGTLVQATVEQDEALLGNADPARSVWYQVNVPAGQIARITVTPTNVATDVLFAVITGTDFTDFVAHRYALEGAAGVAERTTIANPSASSQTYFIEVALQEGSPGAFQIQLALDASGPANDHFANAQALAGAGTFAGTTVNASAEIEETNSSSSPPFASVWYSLPVPAGQRATVTLTPTGFDSHITAYKGTTYATLSVVDFDDATGSGSVDQVRLDNRLGSTVTYRIQVDGVNFASGAFSLDVALSPVPPVNDDAANAVTVFQNTTVNGTTVNATAEANEPAHAGSAATRSVWYYVQVDSLTKGTVTVTPSGFDARVAIYSGSNSDIANLVPVASSNSAGSGGAEIVESTNFGFLSNILLVAVDGVGAGSGTFTIHFQTTSAALANDNFANAVTLPTSNPQLMAFNTTNATAEASEPQLNSGAPMSLWYRFTAPADGKFSIYTNSNAGPAPSYALFTGASVGALTTVSAYAAEHVEVSIQQGQTFFIALSTPSGQPGSGTFNYSFRTLNSGEFSFSDATYSADEASSEVVLTVQRDSADGEVTVDYTISPGGASTSDYTGTGGTLTFPDGIFGQEIHIPIVDDTDQETLESFTVSLGTPSTGTLGTQSSATVSIAANDTPGGGGGGGGGGGTGGNVADPIDAMYRGIINPTGAPGTVGVLTVKTTAKGPFTGKLVYGGKTYPLKGKFSRIFGVNAIIHRPGLPSIGVSLEFDNSGNVRAYFDAGDGSFAFDVSRTPFTKKNPTPLAGAYAGPLGAAALLAQGGGVAFVAIKPDGKVTIKGTLPDGTPFITTSALTSAGYFGFHKPLYANRGHFSGNAAVTSGTRFTGGIKWIKPQGAGGYFSSTGVSVTAALDVSRYTKSAKNTRALASLNATSGAAVVTFTGLDIAGNVLAIGATVDTKNKVTPSPTDTHALKLTINAATGAVGGTFSDTFTPPLAKPRVTKVFGVVDQRTGSITGFYLGPVTPGGFVLAPLMP